MSAAEVLPLKWPAKVVDPAVKGHNRSGVLRMSMKDYSSWHSRTSSNLIFFCVTLGVGALLTTLNAAGFLSGSEGGPFLSTAISSADAESSSPLRSDGPWVVPHPLSDIFHNMTDEELLSESARSRSRPADVAPKVAFLFLTRGPMPMAPLWERYFKGHVGLYSIYVHAHPDYRPDFPKNSVFYRRIIPSKEVFWGRITIYFAERRLLANALLDAANERFVHLSESCIPISPFPVAYKYLTESEHSFVEVFVDPGKGGLGRYNRIKHPEKLNPEVSPSQWRKGAQWFEMSRALARMVVADRKYLPKFESRFCIDDRVCYSEEHLLPTMLTILAPSKLANRSTTYVDFHLHNPHPKKWEPEEITEASLKHITSSGSNCTYNSEETGTCFLFARKFSPGCVEPLLELATTSFGIPIELASDAEKETDLYVG